MWRILDGLNFPFALIVLNLLRWCRKLLVFLLLMRNVSVIYNNGLLLELGSQEINFLLLLWGRVSDCMTS